MRSKHSNIFTRRKMTMKMITAIIQPEKLDDVKEKLKKVKNELNSLS